MTERKKLVEYALSQVGVSEDPLGTNKQKYGAYLDSTDWYLYKDSTGKTWVHKVNGYDWCTQFHDCSHVATWGIEKARKILFRPVYNNYGAVVKYSYNYYKSAGRTGSTPQLGASIFFQNKGGLSHIGIVVAYNDTTVWTVEGNAGKNNWYVVKNSYSRKSSYIYGYGYPDYKEEEEDEMKFSDLQSLKYVRPTMKGDAVRIVQSVVGCDVDGSFGPATEKAVKAFQASEKITVDGWVGPETWERIWRKAE